MKKWLPILFSPIAAFLTVIYFGQTTLAESSSNKELVKIGVIAPLTGGASNRGKDITDLLEILEPHINAQSTKYRYKFLVDDGKCGAGSSATTIAKKFIHVDHIKFFITGCSGETLQVGPIAQRNKVISIAVLSNHKDVKQIGDFVFRTFTDIDRDLHKYTAFIREEGKTRIAILTEENAFTNGMKDLLLKYLDSRIVFADDFTEDTVDFNTLLTKIKSKNPDAVYFNVMSDRTLATLVNQAKALGLNSQYYGYFFPESQGFVEKTGKNGEGLKFLGFPVIENESEDFKIVLSEFMRAHPEGPSAKILLRTLYDAVLAIYDGVESVGPNAVLVKQFLKDYQTQGALGTVSFDELGDIKNISFTLKQIRNGKIIVIEG